MKGPWGEEIAATLTKRGIEKKEVPKGPVRLSK
jgi:hypothetical protein